MQGFSIIICTYNPALPLLDRLFAAVRRLKQADLSVEIILVDNNSAPAIAGFSLIQDFLKAQPEAKLILASNPGLTSARIAGIQAAQYDWLVFFDDDNEPAADYLTAAAKVFDAYPQVGVWGPGVVNVEYTGEVNSWLQEHKIYFQQRNEEQVRYSAHIHWQPEYPYGTGMIIQKEIAIAYVAFVQSKKYTVSDRKGKDLSSGGDVQLVFTGIAMGKAAGVSPEIQINHLIQPSKTSFNYLKKLVYGTASSYLMAFNQVYPAQMIPFSPTGNIFIIRLCWFYLRQYQQTADWRTAHLSFIHKLGEINAMYLANSNQPKPLALRFFEWLFIK